MKTKKKVQKKKRYGIFFDMRSINYPRLYTTKAAAKKAFKNYKGFVNYYVEEVR